MQAYQRVSATVWRRGGFTLIELLTVIAVIAILAAILIPVISRVRDQARNAVCQSNLREWHTAWMLYANDNHGRLPLGHHNGPADTPSLWLGFLAPYVDLDLQDGSSVFFNNTDTIAKCPEDHDNPFGEYYPSYGYNTYTFGMRQPLSDRLLIDNVTPQTLVFGDRDGSWHYSGRRPEQLNRPGVSGNPDLNDFRHAGGTRINFVLASGSIHVTRFDENQEPSFDLWYPDRP